MSREKEKKLLDEVRDFMRLKHYSIHTERTYCDWIKKYVFFHKMNSREDLQNGEEKIERFLTHLAVDGDVAPATQNQAMNALVFLYKKVLKQPLQEEINAVRAAKKINIPVVMTRDEVRQIRKGSNLCLTLVDFPPDFFNPFLQYFMLVKGKPVFSYGDNAAHRTVFPNAEIP